MIHELKTWPCYYDRIIEGKKNFEVRKNDRDFQVGDTLSLHRYDPETEARYSGKIITANVEYILHGPNFGIQEGYCVMGIRVIHSQI